MKETLQCIGVDPEEWIVVDVNVTLGVNTWEMTATATRCRNPGGSQPLSFPSGFNKFTARLVSRDEVHITGEIV